MRRRALLALGGAAVACWPWFACAEDASNTLLVGVLMPSDAADPSGPAALRELRTGLRERGWSEDRNLRLDIRWGLSGSVAAATVAAEDLIRLGAKVIVTTNTPLTQGARKATQLVPIVMTAGSDPVSSHLVASMAHPGGNITGFSNYDFSIGAKWLQLLKEVEPRVDRVLVLADPGNDGNRGLLAAIVTAAQAISVTVSTANKGDVANLDTAFKKFSANPNGGVIALPIPPSDALDIILRDSSEYRLPAIYPQGEMAQAGGLMSYSIDSRALYRAAASYVDRILRGERPGDLPVQSPTKFSLVVNLKTAKAMGLSMPPQLLAQADQVIE